MFDQEASFCWCLWNIEILISELFNASDILVRAMDESMNVQPRDMYWTVLGMMNNSWFRVAIHLDGDNLRFEHPTQPALIPGGWMERVKKAGGNLTNGYWGEQIGIETQPELPLETEKEIKMTKDGVKSSISIDELRKHDTADNPWFVVDGEVYDGTAFLNDHPGGGQSIISAAGLDSTEEFVAIHSETAKAMMPNYHIGTLDDGGKAALRVVVEQAPASEPLPTFLEPKLWKRAILHSKRTVSWDTRIFTFKLEHDHQLLGLPIGQHLFVRLRDPATREAIIRSYTPISAPSKTGYMDLLVKIYFESGKYTGGQMSQALDSVPMGHFVEFKGPIGKLSYLGSGICAINNVEHRVRTLVMICAGSGIAPIYQVLRAVMQEPSEVRCIVLDGNRLIEDILCKDELDAFASDASGRCRIEYTLSQAPDDWKSHRGRIDTGLIKKYAGRDQQLEGRVLALICGPKGFEKSIHESLLDVGYVDNELLFF